MINSFVPKGSRIKVLSFLVCSFLLSEVISILNNLCALKNILTMCLCCIFMYVYFLWLYFFSNSLLWCWNLFMFLSVVKYSHPAIDRGFGCFSFLHSQTALLGTFLNARASLVYIYLGLWLPDKKVCTS